MPGSSTPLPLGVAKRLGDWEYEFAARVETLSQGSFAGRAQELLALVADHPHGLAGTFPGSPHAFTAMLAQRHEGQVRWRTWHAYPQEGSLVATRTRVGARPSAARRPPPSGLSDPRWPDELTARRARCRTRQPDCDRPPARRPVPSRSPFRRSVPQAASGAARLPVRPGSDACWSSPAVFVCAACGLVYELELVALASYLVGDSVTQASVVLSVMVFAMGVGSLLAKRLRCRAAVGFGAVEAALALVGGCSAMALYAGFAWFGESRGSRSSASPSPSAC